MSSDEQILGLPLREIHARVDALRARWGWPPAELSRLPAECARVGPLEIVHYFTIGEMDEPLYVQVNLHGEAHPLLAMTCVYAMRYRLCSGWHGVLLHESPAELLAEADGAACWLAREHFTSAAARKAYRAAHPECRGWSWRRIREEAGPPYEQSTCWQRRLER